MSVNVFVLIKTKKYIDGYVYGKWNEKDAKAHVWIAQLFTCNFK